MCTWRRLRSKPQSCESVYVGAAAHPAVVALPFCAQDWHPGDPGLVHAAVPRGGGHDVVIQLYACPPRDRTSISASSSSLRTTTSTSESGRRKSRRCCRIVLSTHLHEATPPLTKMRT